MKQVLYMASVAKYVLFSTYPHDIYYFYGVPQIQPHLARVGALAGDDSTDGVLLFKVLVLCIIGNKELWRFSQE